jgi:hypothetical protein
MRQISLVRGTYQRRFGRKYLYACNVFVSAVSITRHRMEIVMPNTLIKVYDDFSVAQNARDQLLASGFPSSSVHLSARDDEAGPVEGNFTVGNKDLGPEGIGGLFRSMFGSSDDPGKSNDPYTRDFSNVVQRGIYILTVDANNDDESARASDIMDRFGAAQPGAKEGGGARGE